MKKLFFLLPLLLVLSGCKTHDYFSEKPRVSSSIELDSAFLFNAHYEYKIRTNDKISISIWGVEELSIGSVYVSTASGELYGKWVMVDANGNVELPRIGTYQVSNKTITEVKASVKEEMKKWMVNPIVDVKVLNKEISMLGELKFPGVIKVDKDQNNLMEMLARVGGVEMYANLKAVKIIRQQGDKLTTAVVDISSDVDYVAKNINLLPGDVVIVPSSKEKTRNRKITLIGPILYSITTIVTIIRILN